VINHTDYYVYILFRPWNGQPCYVGKGRQQRIFYHNQRGQNHPNRELAKIFAASNGDLPAVKIRENLTDDEALKTETALIAAIGRNYIGPLVNLTNGGDGRSGYKCSQETKAKMSAAVKRRVYTPEQRARYGDRHRGPRSAETKKKMSDAHKGKKRENCPPLTEDHKRKLSVAIKGRKLPPRSSEHSAKISLGKKTANRRTAPKFTHAGLTMTIPEWAEHLGISLQALQYRVYKWCDFGRAVTQPISEAHRH
jgi:hypothetical protein